jgi:hypothetical protein
MACTREPLRGQTDPDDSSRPLAVDRVLGYYTLPFRFCNSEALCNLLQMILRYLPSGQLYDVASDNNDHRTAKVIEYKYDG